jgi:hypothetical protein
MWTWRGEGELLGGEHIVGLGDTGRVIGERHRAVVELRIGGGHDELLRG